METISLIRKNTIVSLFPIKVKNTKFTDKFPLREKVEKIPSFSKGRKMYPLTGGNIYISLTVKGGKKGGLKRCPPSFLPLSFDKYKISFKTKCDKNNKDWK